MEKLIIDTNKKYGKFKLLNAVNNGPTYKRGNTDQLRSNFETYKAAGIPYARNHDAAFCNIYGGEHSVDISAIFPDFNADVNDPASYDFTLTDEYIEATLDAGTKTYYRLGQKIEHSIKKYGTLPPKDFNKWAEICEHMIRHFNYGWAGGKHYGIEYWEIWNEPDLDPDDSPNKRTWGGTKAQFFDLYEITAKHLKSKFPELKIGGPALAHSVEWAKDFIEEMARRKAPIDFFSWHIYSEDVAPMLYKGKKYREFLDANGYEKAESICNEWNYIRGWSDEFIYSIKALTSAKGAAFILSYMAASQQSSVDMLMYYDARPTVFNGMFDYYTLDPLPGYYPFYWYNKLYNGYSEVRITNPDPDIYSLCGVREDGKRIMLVCHYNKDDSTPDKDVSFDFGAPGKYNIYLVNNEVKNELIATVDNLEFTMKNFDCMLIEEV